MEEPTDTQEDGHVDIFERDSLVQFSKEAASATHEHDGKKMEQLHATMHDPQAPVPSILRGKFFRKLKSWCDLSPDSGKVELKKEITIFSGVAILVCDIIGSGIFITPSIVFSLTGSFGTSMFAWVIGAIISLAGALCYIEVGLVVRKSGGEYAYILEAYSFKRRNHWVAMFGSILAFLVTWTLTFFIRGVSVAIITLSCARYLIRPFFIGCECGIPENILKLVALFLLTLLIIANCYSVKLVVRLMAVFTVLKLVAVVFILFLGLVTIARRGEVSEGIHQPFKTYEDIQLTPSSLALSLYSVMWAYDGWNTLNYPIEETKNVEKTLPRSLFIGIPIVAVCYLLVNFAFFSILTYEEILNAEAVAIPFGEVAGLGSGLFIISLIVGLSSFGSALASMFASTRLIHSSSRDGLLPKMFSGVHSSYKTPVTAVLLLGALTVIIILSGSITQLIDSFGAASFFFYMLVFLGLIIMRVTHRSEPRPFKAWFILPVAVLAVLFSIFLLIVPLLREEVRLPTLVAFAIISLGVPVYIFLVMETPWKLRPKVLDRISYFLTRCSNAILNTCTD